ncbi:MAG TPA: organomercurial lyase [Dissulfurispiraceae bacterium]
MKPLTIGTLAKRAQVNIDTIRYYERRGLMPPAARRASGYRQYGEDAVARIQFIKKTKELGFSLDEIAELLALSVAPHTTCGDIKKKVAPKLAEIREKIRSLQQMGEMLEKLIRQCDGNEQTIECPFIEALAMSPESGGMPSLMDRISEAVRGALAKAKLSSTEELMRKYILGTFSRYGSPPSPAEIMEEFHLPSLAEVNRSLAKLEKYDIISRKDGTIISAYPFSASTTRHRVIFEDGRAVYALCSTDALGIHFMVGKDITVFSSCPESKKEIKIVVKDGRIASRHPKGIVEFVSQGESGCCTAETFCPHMNFFYSRTHLGKWIKKNPKYEKGETYMPEETLQHGKNIFGGFLKDASDKAAQSSTKHHLKGQRCTGGCDK